MNSDTHNNVGQKSSTSLLDEADELARSWKWTRSFALYIMFCKAMAAGDKIRAESSLKLLESEVMNELADPVFGRVEKSSGKMRSKFTLHLSPYGLL
jgi:hypothetical protein